MKRLGLEIPDYDPNIDPTRNKGAEPVLEWNILKRDIKEMKQKYDQLVKDYKKRKADEKAQNGMNKKLKTKKLEEDDKKLSDILKLKSEIIKESKVAKYDLTKDEENDDLFVE